MNRYMHRYVGTLNVLTPTNLRLHHVFRFIAFALNGPNLLNIKLTLTNLEKKKQKNKGIDISLNSMLSMLGS